MPIHRGIEKGTGKAYYTYGTTNKHYYYIVGNKKSRQEAIEKCKAQRKAIYASKGKTYDFPVT